MANRNVIFGAELPWFTGIMVTGVPDRAAWMEALYSTEPADRPRAEAAARGLYRALGLEEPRHILWFEGPSAGAWVAAVLLSATNDLWCGTVQRAGQDPAQQAPLEQARARLGSIEGGPSLERRLTGKRLFLDRLSLYPDLQTFQRASLFTDEDDLYRAERAFRGSWRGAAGHQESAGKARSLMNGSPLTVYPMSRMAADEAQAAGGPVPPLLAALWELARSSGIWWAFEQAIVLTDRPSEVHLNDRLEPHSAEGPAIVYRDGWGIYAWEGQAVDRPEPPEAVFRFDGEGFAATPRQVSHPGKSLLERYSEGAYQEVWQELMALGPAVREARYAKPARLVAEETMRRVGANVDTVIRRLGSMDYRFRMKNGAHIPPGAQTDRFWRELEKVAGPVPLSLAAFYRIVGSVDLAGRGEGFWMFPGGYLLPDPLVVFPLEQVLRDYGAPAGGSPGRIPIAEDGYDKAGIPGGALYEMAVPDARADGELLNERHGLCFVDYLRLVFRWGGFPGYDGVEHRYGVFEVLRAELLPF